MLGNGNIRTLADCHALMDATGVDGVMSAESLLADPALFSARRLQPGGKRRHLRRLPAWSCCGLRSSTRRAPPPPVDQTLAEPSCVPATPGGEEPSCSLTMLRCLC